jgi:hypothetical protein
MKNVVCLSLLLAACSTPYQEMGFRGGVRSDQVTANTYRIVANGNSFTGRRAIQDYTLLKAAETTKAAGGTHFVIVDAQDASRVSYDVSPGRATTVFSGNIASTTYSPARAHADVKPGQDTYIRVLTIAAGMPIPPDAYSADEIIQFIGSRVTKG